MKNNYMKPVVDVKTLTPDENLAALIVSGNTGEIGTGLGESWESIFGK